MPGSAVYKYPPAWAALLQPFIGLPWKTSARILLGLNTALLVLALVVSLRLTSRSPSRIAVAVLVFISWQPFWESMGGMQLEMMVLLLLTLTVAARRAGRSFWSGVPVGVAAALKVYPVGLVAWFAWRRDLRAIAGAITGATVMFLGSAVVLRPAFVLQFFELLPSLGGTSLGPDNLSVLGTSGRFGVALLQGTEPLRQATALGRVETVFTTLASPPARVLALGLSGLIGTALLYLTWRAARRSLTARETDPEGGTDAGFRLEAAFFGAAICLLLFLMPTSWPDYQTLLFLPLLLGLAWIRSPREDPVAWGLLLAAGVAGAIPLDSGPLSRQPNWTPAIRGWIPLAIWWVLIHIESDRVTPAGRGR